MSRLVKVDVSAPLMREHCCADVSVLVPDEARESAVVFVNYGGATMQLTPTTTELRAVAHMLICEADRLEMARRPAEEEA